jgi:excisionase family DNA binding protein
MPPKLISTNELAEFLGVSRVTVRRWARDGVIPVLRGGTQPMLFELDVVIAVLRNNGQAASQEAVAAQA